MAEALKIASGALTALIALLALAIAYQQYRVNVSKLKLDLHEKRYAVFHSLMELFHRAPRRAGRGAGDHAGGRLRERIEERRPPA